jgi:hypothetical protein
VNVCVSVPAAFVALTVKVIGFGGTVGGPKALKTPVVGPIWTHVGTPESENVDGVGLSVVTWSVWYWFVPTSMFGMLFVIVMCGSRNRVKFWVLVPIAFVAVNRSGYSPGP